MFSFIAGQRLEAQHLSEELNALNDQLRSNEAFILFTLYYFLFLAFFHFFFGVNLFYFFSSPCISYLQLLSTLHFLSSLLSLAVTMVLI